MINGEHLKESAQIPNVIFDEICPHLMDSEVRVVMCIARKTFGFNKLTDEISYSQYEAMTKYRRQSLIRILERLEIKGVIVVNRVPGGSKKVSNSYAINLEWAPVTHERRHQQETSPESESSCNLPYSDHVTHGLHTKPILQNPIQNTDPAPASPFTPLLNQYAKKVGKVDRIGIDYRLTSAVAEHGAETVERCITAIIQAADDPQYPRDKLPSLSALLRDPERVDWWARRVKSETLTNAPYLSDPEKLARTVEIKRKFNRQLTDAEVEACKRLQIA